MLEHIQDAIVKDANDREKADGCKAVEEKLALLTPREREILDLVRAGQLNKVVAQELKLSRKTVEVHRAHIMEKMQVDSTAELVTLLNKVELVQ